MRRDLFKNSFTWINKGDVGWIVLKEEYSFSILTSNKNLRLVFLFLYARRLYLYVILYYEECTSYH